MCESCEVSSLGVAFCLSQSCCVHSVCRLCCVPFVFAMCLVAIVFGAVIVFHLQGIGALVCWVLPVGVSGCVCFSECACW